MNMVVAVALVVCVTLAMLGGAGWSIDSNADTGEDVTEES